MAHQHLLCLYDLILTHQLCMTRKNGEKKSGAKAKYRAKSLKIIEKSRKITPSRGDRGVYTVSGVLSGVLSGIQTVI